MRVDIFAVAACVSLVFLSFASEHTDTTQPASVAWAARLRGAAMASSGHAQGSVQPAGVAVRTSLRRLPARTASAYSFLQPRSQSPPNPPPPPQTTATAAASSSARAPRRCPGLQRSEEQAGLPAVAFLRSCEPAASLTWPQWSRAAPRPSGSCGHQLVHRLQFPTGSPASSSSLSSPLT
jgi:hypothetical protein